MSIKNKIIVSLASPVIVPLDQEGSGVFVKTSHVLIEQAVYREFVFSYGDLVGYFDSEDRLVFLEKPVSFNVQGKTHVVAVTSVKA